MLTPCPQPVPSSIWRPVAVSPIGSLLLLPRCSACLQPPISFPFHTFPTFPMLMYRTTILDEPLLGGGLGATDDDAI